MCELPINFAFPPTPLFSLKGGVANNPFAADAAEAAAAASQYTATGTRLQTGQEGQYYGRGYSQAQSGYSASGLGEGEGAR